MEVYIITLILVAIMSVISYYLVPFLIANTSVKQRQEALFWINITVKIAEQAFKDKGIGPFKKDYVIKDVNGEFYPCKPDVFEKTYDVVENAERPQTFGEKAVRITFNPSGSDEVYEAKMLAAKHK